ncbi:MAG TPA: phosphoribosylamine--glycine ligase [Candidatus Saccharimonadales bacterium]|nr:phosphoribosylamine--glycine ligase [Candidatus Saccharimonadales bacterium]
MKVLVIGGGGREHSLVWKLMQSPQVEKVWCAPGNGGIEAEAECVPVDTADVPALVAITERLGPDLTIVGPELPLVNGIGDAFRDRGWPIVAPSRRAAQLEGSKVFAKEFLRRHGIPTAEMYGAFDSVESAVSALSGLEWPVVIKADGLCAGKGVFVAQDAPSAEEFIRRAMDQNEFGAGGRRLLLEEALEGEELSFIIVTDGQRHAPLVPTRDHKRVSDGNHGPNTGGMGAYSTDDLLPAKLRQQVVDSIVEPTLRGLASDGILYQGFLYIGLMLTSAGPKVLEFNCRLGDPETQAIVARMDFDLAQVLGELAAGTLEPARLKWKPGASVCVVMAAGGYPGRFTSGKRIEGLTDAELVKGVNVFHAGTRSREGSIVTSGGRVLGVTAAAASIEAAVAMAYEAAGKIRFEGMHYRKDIGAQAGRVHAAGD